MNVQKTHGENYDGYRALMASVMLTAVNDFLGTPRCGENDYKSAYCYLFEGSLHDCYVFSFASVCRYIGLDAESVREALRNKKMGEEKP
jgi:hypothetical protein